MGPMPSAMAGSAPPAPRGSHFLVSMSPWHQARSSAPARSPRTFRGRWAIKSPALIPARNPSSRTARERRPTRTLARRSMSALQPVPATFWPSSSRAASHPRTSAACGAIERDTALWRLVRHDDGTGGEYAANTVTERPGSGRRRYRGSARALVQGLHAAHIRMHVSRGSPPSVLRMQSAAGAVLR